jgi:hypothetical protein
LSSSERLAELVLRLRVNTDFQEFWKIVEDRRDALVQDAIHNAEGNPAEKRGAARELDSFVKLVENSPEKAKKLKSMRQ